MGSVHSLLTRLLAVLALLAGPASADDPAVLAPDRQMAVESVLSLLLHERGGTLSPESEAQIGAIRFLSFQGGLDPRNLRRTGPGEVWYDVVPGEPVPLRLGPPHDATIELLLGSFGLAGGAFVANRARLSWDGAVYDSEAGRWIRVWRRLAVIIAGDEVALARLGLQPGQMPALRDRLAATFAEGGDYLGLFRDLVLANGGAENARNSDFALFSTVMCELRDDICDLPLLVGLVGLPF